MTTPDSIETARSAGLRYVSDTQPGIQRRRAGKGFSYRGPNGQSIHDAATLRRIKALAIPPAWKAVWICPSPDGHIQATGRDARGRKQYRYDTRWRTYRDENKYSRMLAFAGALPRIRAQVQQDMAEPGLARTKVLATIVRLLETTLIRVGNEEYARANKSFGLTTMHDKHVQINGSTLHFEFRGKSGVKHNLDLRDRRLAQIVKHCRDIPGHELFQYIDERGERQTIDSGDVNEYLRAVSGDDFTAKDFRTWAGTVLAALALKEFEPFDSQTQAKKNVVRAIETVAERLGNTAAVCRKCYIHPAVVDAYLEGTLIESLRQPTGHKLAGDSDLPPEEAAVLALLQQRLAASQESGA
jgi:DNA topoisomerase-1